MHIRICYVLSYRNINAGFRRAESRASKRNLGGERNRGEGNRVEWGFFCLKLFFSILGQKLILRYITNGSLHGLVYENEHKTSVD